MPVPDKAGDESSNPVDEQQAEDFWGSAFDALDQPDSDNENDNEDPSQIVPGQDIVDGPSNAKHSAEAPSDQPLDSREDAAVPVSAKPDGRDSEKARIEPAESAKEQPAGVQVP